MEKHISIPKLCPEKWDGFKPTLNGGFCKSCSKEVTDFTKMNDRQIIDHLEKSHQPGCGRVHSHQLRSYPQRTFLNSFTGSTILRAGFLSLFFALFAETGFAQSDKVQPQSTRYDSHQVGERLVKGVVRSDEEGEVMPYVSIYLKDNPSIGTVTDENGRFEFPRKLSEADVLIISYLGYNTQEYIVSASTVENIEIRMVSSYIEMMGEVAVGRIYREETGAGKLWKKFKGLF